MKKLLPFALAALVPAAALALDYDDLTGRYEDAPFSRTEAAGISVLTEIDAVAGNPDGTFAPGRTLNRAEFTKIALLAGRMPPSTLMNESTEACFPDVTAEHWFRPYVCAAKAQDVVQGNPDGMFHPARPVNYAEATKILVEIFGYELPAIKASEAPAWYVPYMTAAKDKGVALPGDVSPAHELTRGQMARLAAAFVAESEGELESYRAFERGEAVSSSSSSSSASSAPSSAASSSSSVSSSSSSSRSSSSVSSSRLFPALSRFLVAGTTTPVLLDGIFTSADEDGTLTSVELELRREISALESLQLVDGAGTVIATLALQSYSNADDTKWRADISSGAYTLPKDAPVRLGIRAKVKPAGAGGTSNELFELRTLSLRATGKASGNSRQIVPTDTHYPFHQTALGSIVSVRDDLGSALTVAQGQKKLLGTFTVAGRAASGASVRVESLSFTLLATDVSVTNLKIGGTSAVQQGDCSTERFDDRTILTCLVPESMRDITTAPVTLNVYGDLTVAAAKQTGTVHLSSLGTGGIGSSGAVRWNDVSHSFTWIEGDAILESGPVVTVTK